VKVLIGFILLVLGILGVARGSIDAAEADFGNVTGTGFGVGSFITLIAAFLLVGGLLILARADRFSFGSSREHRRAGNNTPHLRE